MVVLVVISGNELILGMSLIKMLNRIGPSIDGPCSSPSRPRLLDHVVSGARFLTAGVFECDLAHRQSEEILCMQYKTRWILILCILFMVLYLCLMCRCWLHMVL